jgi:hypothetical protein
VVIPPLILDEPIPPPGKPQGSPAQETAKALEAGKESEAKVEKALEKPPPPGAWERRLKFWWTADAAPAPPAGLGLT